MNTWATYNAVKGCDKGRKWPYLENLSITTRITSQLWERGRASLKSRLTISHGRVGSGSGCSSPGILTCSTFACWQIPHAYRCQFDISYSLFKTTKIWKASSEQRFGRRAHNCNVDYFVWSMLHGKIVTIDNLAISRSSGYEGHIQVFRFSCK
jgi:hypothetical protein